ESDRALLRSELLVARARARSRAAGSSSLGWAEGSWASPVVGPPRASISRHRATRAPRAARAHGRRARRRLRRGLPRPFRGEARFGPRASRPARAGVSRLASRLTCVPARRRRLLSARPADGKLSKGAMNMHDIDRTMGRTNMEAYEF